MNRINPIVLSNLKSNLMGRLRLSLFKAILGKEDMVPSVKEVQRYIRKFSENQLTIAEIAVYVLNDARFATIRFEDLALEIDVVDLFSYLDKYPLKKPMFYEVSGYYEDKPIGVLVHCHELKENIGFFYAITFMDENYPTAVSYFEIRTSQKEPEPAFCYYTENGEWVSSAKTDTGIKKNEPVWFCVQILKHMVDHYTESFITLKQSLEKGKKVKFIKRDTAPNDPVYSFLIQKVFLGQKLCHVAEVDIQMVRPFSFDACFMISYFEIQQGKRELEDHKRDGLVVYWKDGQFITSDDYLAYIVFRVSGVQKVKIVILGNEGTSNAKVFMSGGADLLPGVHLFSKSGIDQMEEGVRNLYLDEYIAKLSATMNLKDLLQSKCIIFSEDDDTQILETLLQANGFNTDETTIMSYYNCTKIDLLPLTLDTLRKIKKDFVFVVHRDRDYLSAQALEAITYKIESLGALAFITEGTDIESHFLNPGHINSVYPSISLQATEDLLDQARLQTRELSIGKMLKEKYGNKHESFAGEKHVFAEQYDADPSRFCSGKETMRRLKSLLHPKVTGNVNLFKISDHLESCQLKEIASNIWPYST